jgi:hypothetical protein
MKQLQRIVAVALVVIATIVGISITTSKGNKFRNIHQTRMERSSTFKSALR